VAVYAYEGKNLEAVREFGLVSADALVCSSAAAYVCPAWTAGRTVGGVINYVVGAVRADGKDATGLAEDFYLYVDEKATLTARELVRLQIAVKKLSDKRRERASYRTCSNPRQTREGVDALLRTIATPRKPELQISKPGAHCEILKDTVRAERYAEEDPAGYDELLARCLK
tara:strand:- start:27623 stop:28135 length:513 start_codon:yes stop_codon:yes gene_type:complete